MPPAKPQENMTTSSPSTANGSRATAGYLLSTAWKLVWWILTPVALVLLAFVFIPVLLATNLLGTAFWVFFSFPVLMASFLLMSMAASVIFIVCALVPAAFLLPYHIFLTAAAITMSPSLTIPAKILLLLLIPAAVLAYLPIMGIGILFTTITSAAFICSLSCDEPQSWFDMYFPHIRSIPPFFRWAAKSSTALRRFLHTGVPAALSKSSSQQTSNAEDPKTSAPLIITTFVCGVISAFVLLPLSVFSSVVQGVFWGFQISFYRLESWTHHVERHSCTGCYGDNTCCSFPMLGLLAVSLLPAGLVSAVLLSLPFSIISIAVCIVLSPWFLMEDLKKSPPESSWDLPLESAKLLVQFSLVAVLGPMYLSPEHGMSLSYPPARFQQTLVERWGLLLCPLNSSEGTQTASSTLPKQPSGGTLVKKEATKAAGMGGKPSDTKTFDIERGDRDTSSGVVLNGARLNGGVGARKAPPSSRDTASTSGASTLANGRSEVGNTRAAEKKAKEKAKRKAVANKEWLEFCKVCRVEGFYALDSGHLPPSCILDVDSSLFITLPHLGLLHMILNPPHKILASVQRQHELRSSRLPRSNSNKASPLLGPLYTIVTDLHQQLAQLYPLNPQELHFLREQAYIADDVAADMKGARGWSSHWSSAWSSGRGSNSLNSSQFDTATTMSGLSSPTASTIASPTAQQSVFSMALWSQESTTPVQQGGGAGAANPMALRSVVHPQLASNQSTYSEPLTSRDAPSPCYPPSNLPRLEGAVAVDTGSLVAAGDIPRDRLSTLNDISMLLCCAAIQISQKHVFKKHFMGEIHAPLSERAAEVGRRTGSGGPLGFALRTLAAPLRGSISRSRCTRMLRSGSETLAAKMSEQVHETISSRMTGALLTDAFGMTEVPEGVEGEVSLGSGGGSVVNGGSRLGEDYGLEPCGQVRSGALQQVVVHGAETSRSPEITPS